jgi:hypothetical protein
MVAHHRFPDMLTSRDLLGLGDIHPGAVPLIIARPEPDPKQAIERTDDTAP